MVWPAGAFRLLCNSHRQSLHIFSAFYLLIAGLFFITALGDTATAVTYYLDAAVGSSGNGTSWTQAKKTWADMDSLLDALGDDGAGDTVDVNTGNYGAVSGGVLKKVRTDWLTIQAATGKTPVFTRIVISAGSSVNGYVKFDGINITHPAPDPLPPDDGYWHYDDVGALGYLMSVTNTNYVQFLNGTYTGYNKYLSKGVYLNNSDNVTIHHCEIRQNNSSGIVDIVDCDNLTVTGCYLHDTCGAGGLRIQGASTGTLFENNHIFLPKPDTTDAYYPHIEASRYYYYLTKTGDFITGENVVQVNDHGNATGWITAQSDGLLRIYRTSSHPMGGVIFAVNYNVVGQTSDANAVITTIGVTPNYHPGSGFAIRSSNVSIRKNIVHGGATSQGLMFYLDVENMTVENNLFYDCGEVKIENLVGACVVRNNTGIGCIRDITVGNMCNYRYSGYPLQVNLKSGYDGAGVSIYNNVSVGEFASPDPNNPDLHFTEDYNISWMGYDRVGKITKGAHSKIVVWKVGKVLHGWYDYFEDIGYETNTDEYTHVNPPQAFFVDPNYKTDNSYGHYAWANGKTCDYHLAAGSPGINFGDPYNQPSDSLGSIGPDGFIIDDGPARDASHHSAGCYEFVPDSSPPTKPQNLTAQAVSHTQMNLVWQASSDAESGISHYRIYRNGARISTTTATSFSDAGLVPGTTYSYQVSAVNRVGAESEKSVSASDTTWPDNTPPSAPKNLTAQAVSQSQIDLTWDASADPESGIDHYNIYRNGATTPSAISTSTSFSDTGLLPATAYSYEVSAVNRSGAESQKSNTIQGTTPTDTMPPVISNIRASDITSSGTTIAWSTNEPSTTRVDYGPTSSYGNTTSLDASLVTSHAALLTSLTADSLYHYRVRSKDASGNESVSQDYTFTTAPASTSPDSSPPAVTNCSPAPDSIQVPLNSLVSLHVVDTGKGVDAGSVIIKVNGNTVYAGDTAHYSSSYGDCRRTGTKADYTFSYQPNQMFDFEQEVTVTVNATDLGGNVMNEYSYSFWTEMRSFGQNKKVSVGLDSLSNVAPATVRDSSGNTCVVWHAGPAGSRDIYVNKLVDEAANFTGSIQLIADPADQCNPGIAVGSSDKLYVVWQDNRRGNWDIYMSTSADGINWSTGKITDSNNNEINPAIAIGSTGRAAITWQDDRAGNQDIYVATSSDGFATKDVVQITRDGFNQTEPAIAVGSDNTVYVVWTDSRSGSNDIYGAASNSGPWTNVPIVNKAGNQSSPAIAAETAGSILHLLWVDDASGNSDIYHAATNGLPSSPVTGSSIIDDSSGRNQVEPAIAVTGSTGNNLEVFACWQDRRNVAGAIGDTDLYFAKVSSDGGTNVFVGDDSTNSNQSQPAIGVDRYGYPYIVWADSRNTNPQAYYAGSTYLNPEPLASQLVSASVGAIVGTRPENIDSVDDVSVTVPAGACSCDLQITISEVKNPQGFAAQCLAVYDFGPSGVQFNQPVKIMIPYTFSGRSSKPYWFNSLTGALSQQGMTNIQDMEISPTLHVLSFETTHFTPFYVVEGTAGGTGGGGGGCSVSATGNGSIVEFLLPYMALAAAMMILKLHDTRERKARKAI